MMLQCCSEKKLLRQLPVLLSISALLVVPFVANAGVIVYDSLPQSSSGADPVGSFGPLYDSFSTGADSGPISSVSFLLSGDNTDGGTISANLYADNSDTVGGLISALGTISDASLTGGLSVVNLPLGSNPSLNTGTRYWIGLSTSASATRWAWTTDTSGTGVNGEFFQNSFGTFPNIPQGGYQMQVALASVPEPSTFVLEMIALAALGVFARRRRLA
jgi:hypothetical protein